MPNLFLILIGYIAFYAILIICYHYAISAKCSIGTPADVSGIKDEFMGQRGDTLHDLEENLQNELNMDFIFDQESTLPPKRVDILAGDLGSKVSTAINKQRENDQFYFNPNVANCNASTGLNCAKPFRGQEFAEGWFV